MTTKESLGIVGMIQRGWRCWSGCGRTCAPQTLLQGSTEQLAEAASDDIVRRFFIEDKMPGVKAGLNNVHTYYNRPLTLPALSGIFSVISHLTKLLNISNPALCRVFSRTKDETMFTRSNSRSNFVIKPATRRHTPSITELKEAERLKQERLQKEEELKQKAEQILQDIEQQKLDAKLDMASMFLAGPECWPDYGVNIDDIPYDPEIEDEDWVPLEYNADSNIDE